MVRLIPLGIVVMLLSFLAACCSTHTFTREGGISIEKKGSSLKVTARDAEPSEVLNCIAEAMGWELDIQHRGKWKITYDMTEFCPAEDVLYRVADEAALCVTREGKGKYKIEYVPRKDDKLSEEELAKKYRTTINPTQPTSGIERGYFIYEGHYIPPPYEITTGKNEVFINGLVVSRKHSPKARGPVSVPDEQNITTIDELYRVVHHKYDQWKSAHGKKTALNNLRDFLNNNPYVQKNVLKFEVGDDETVWFTFNKKGKFNCYYEEEVLLAPWRAAPLSDEKIQEILSQRKDRLSRHLKEGGLIACSHEGGFSHFVPGHRARQFLDRICEVIDSNNETPQKEYALTKLFVVREWARRFLYNFDTAVFKRMNPESDSNHQE